MRLQVVGDDGRRRGQDHLGGAVVLLEADDLGLGEVRFEVEDVADVGAAPRVDGLVRIAHHREVAVVLGQPSHEQVLRPVRVLVLVHHHEAEAPAVAGPDQLGALEQLDGLEQEIVEIERAARGERLHVLVVHPRHHVVAVAGAAGEHGRRRLHAVLGVADARERGTGRQEAVVHLLVAQDLLHGGQLVGRVVDDEIARQAHVRGLAAQQPRAEGVEGGDPHARRRRAEQRRHALAHLLGRLVREGDGEDLARFGHAAPDEIGDAIGDDAGLSGAGAGEDQKRAVGVEDGFSLGRV